MSEGGYKIRNKEGIHFITFAVVEWVDVFTRKEYKDILIESLKHCQKERGLQIYSWCIMSNHVHLVISAIQNDTSEILRDFKKFTSKEIIKAITAHPGESRKEWMLEIFKKEGAANSRNVTYQFWRQDNQPKELFSSNFTNQKLEYIHNNPVEAGIVEKAEEYIYSSARDYYEGKSVGLLEIEFLE
jgi:REP element-mobilizing transposase RayT